jgi:hypothetical protein
MGFRNPKPYVRIDCDIADHVRFQATKNIEVALGAWLRCLAHSHAQEQNGMVTRPWLRRTFPGKLFRRVEELVRVGLLRERDDGDYEIHGYAPRNRRSRSAVTRDHQGGGHIRASAECPNDVSDVVTTPVPPRKVLR